MYCSKCGAEFGSKEAYCFNCGAPRPVGNKTFEKSAFMSGRGLKDNYIPLLWELLILELQMEIISYLILPKSLSYVVMNNIFSLPASLMGSISSGAGLNIDTLLGPVETMLSQMPMLWKVSTGISMLASLLNFILLFLAAWRIFKKANMKGWKILIPIYNIYCVFKIVMGNGWYFLLVVAYYVIYLFSFSGVITTASSFNSAATSTITLMIIMLLVGLIFVIWFAHKAATCFHHGWGYTIGLLCLTNLFIMFLGWGGGVVDEVDEIDEEKDNTDGQNYNINERYQPSVYAAVDQKQQSPMQEEQKEESSETGKCPACGEPVDPDWKFCRHCGARLSE